MHWQRRKDHVDSTFFPTGFWWGCTWFGMRKEINREGPTSHHFTLSILLRSDSPNSTEFHTVTHLHWHLEDVATPTRQRRKTFSNRLTGPQLGAKDSKQWRSSVTSPKVRHLNRSRWRMPRGQWKIMLVCIALENRMRVEPHLRRTPHCLKWNKQTNKQMAQSDHDRVPCSSNRKKTRTEYRKIGHSNGIIRFANNSRYEYSQSYPPRNEDKKSAHRVCITTAS